LVQYFLALAPTFLVAAYFLIFALNWSRHRTWTRAITCAVVLAVASRYLIWRFTETVRPMEVEQGFAFYWVWFLFLVEVLAFSELALFLVAMSRYADRSKEADRLETEFFQRPDDALPTVDVFIPTYDEPLDVLERTIVGALALDYPKGKLKVYVLDDQRRDWLRSFCEQKGAIHVVRGDNAHAKAGNLNNGLKVSSGKFIAIFDADFVPFRNFLRRTLPFFTDPSIGIVQTPQHFFNPDPIQHNLGISAGYPDEQRFFFDHVEASRDAWGIAVCCGTSSMARTAALTQIGGLPTESVTEDFLLTLRLDENGWRTVYLNEPLTEGLAPEGLQEYIVQRGRWCLGMMQIVRNVYNPFGSHRLSLAQRFSMTDSVLYWTSTFSFRLASLICPLLYWYFGIAVVNASVSDVFSYYLPYYAAVLGGLNWLSRGLIVPLLNDVSQVLAAWPVTRAAAMGLIKKGPHKFNVTAKGGDRRRTVVQWPLLWPWLIVLTLTICGLFIGIIAPSRFDFDHVAGDGLEIVIFWTVYNIVLLALTMLACIERPREDRPQRPVIEGAELLVDERHYAAWVTDLGLEQARIRGPAGFSTGTSAALAISEVGSVQAKLIAATRDGYELVLCPSAEQRQRMIGKLYGSHAVPGTAAGDVGLMIKQLARRLAIGR